MGSRVGDQLTSVALLWFVLRTTGSGVALGLVVLCFQLPAMLSSPLLGIGFDCIQPRVLMALDNFGRAALIAAIPALYLVGALHLWMIYALALGAGVLSPATSVGLNLVTPRIVTDAELERANALAAVSWDFATLLGPAVAGVLLLFIGAPLVLLLDALSFLVMGVMVVRLPHLPRPPGTAAPSRHESRSLLGFGILFRLKPVLVLSMLTLLFLFAQGASEIALPVYSQTTLRAGSVGYGALMIAFSAGSLLALSLSHFWTRRSRPGFSLAAILLLSGLTLAPLLIVHTLPFALLVMALAGLAAAPYYVAEQSITQRLVPQDARGRIFGLRGALNVAGYPLGGLVGGLALTKLGTAGAFGTAVILCLAMSIVCLSIPWIRGLRRAPA
jgi:MFS family permease